MKKLKMICLKILKKTNSLPAVCGRVCPQETQCEELCIVGIKSDLSALIYRNLSPIIGAVPQGAMGSQLGEYETLLKESAAPGLACAYGLDDRILISGVGPSLAGLAPLLGLQSVMALDGIVEDGSDELSSPE